MFVLPIFICADTLLLQTHSNDKLKTFPTDGSVCRSLSILFFSNVQYLYSSKNFQIYRTAKGDKQILLKVAQEIDHVRMEANILASLNHSNIISFIGAGEQPYPYIELEYMGGGTLAQLLFLKSKYQSERQINELSMKAALFIARNLVSALKYLHDEQGTLRIIHRGDFQKSNSPFKMILRYCKFLFFLDLKPANIGFTSSGVLKIFDFSVAICVDKQDAENECYELNGFTGTPAYMAPEVAQWKPYNEKADIYSFAVILWQMTTGEIPFESVSPEEFLTTVWKSGQEPLPLYNTIPAGLRPLIKKCWALNLSLRPSATEIFDLLANLIAKVERDKKQSKSFFKAFKYIFSMNNHNHSRIEMEPIPSAATSTTVSPSSSPPLGTTFHSDLSDNTFPALSADEEDDTPLLTIKKKPTSTSTDN